MIHLLKEGIFGSSERKSNNLPLKDFYLTVVIMKHDFKGYCGVCHKPVYYRWHGIKPSWYCTECGIVDGRTYRHEISAENISAITAVDTTFKTLGIKRIKLDVLNAVLKRTFNKSITEKELLRAGYRVTGIKVKTVSIKYKA